MRPLLDENDLLYLVLALDCYEDEITRDLQELAGSTDGEKAELHESFTVGRGHVRQLKLRFLRNLLGVRRGRVPRLRGDELAQTMTLWKLENRLKRLLNDATHVE